MRTALSQPQHQSGREKCAGGRVELPESPPGSWAEKFRCGAAWPLFVCETAATSVNKHSIRTALTARLPSRQHSREI
jgi:hypothetical protein